MLGNSEDHTALSRALSQLAEVEEKIDQLHQEQANADFYLFSELLGDYVRLIAAVKVRPGERRQAPCRVSLSLQGQRSFGRSGDASCADFTALSCTRGWI